MTPLQKAELIEAQPNESSATFGDRVSGTPGLYVVAPALEKNVFRFGKKENCVGGRIRHHGGAKGSFDNITGDLMPYEPKLAWRLSDWPAYRVQMAEIAMFGAVSAQRGERFWSETRGKTDKSNFKLPDSFDWAVFCKRVGTELDAIAALGE